MNIETKTMVYVVDDDTSVCKSLDDLISSAGLDVKTFTSARDFLADTLPDYPSCLVADVKMPDMTGLELQNALALLNRFIPMIFITGHGNVPTSVQAMKAGAIDFLEKPFDGNVLLETISRAIEKDLEFRQRKDEISLLKGRWNSLTLREREVFELITAGLLNKQIAYQLGVAEITIKIHRARIMQKMDSTSLADLVRKAEKLKEA